MATAADQRRDVADFAPLPLHHVDAAIAPRLVPPPASVLDDDATVTWLTGEPMNLAHVLGADEDGGASAGRRAGEIMRAYAAAGHFRPAGAALAIHEIVVEGHRQRGIVAGVSTDLVASGVVRPHEQTRTQRERLLADFLDAAGVDTSPIVLAYARIDDLMRLIDEVTAHHPDAAFTSFGGVAHRVWLLRDRAQTTAALEAMRAIPQLTIIDGHHRVAAAMRRSEGAAPQTLLAEVVCDDELQMRGIDRVVGLGSTTPEQLLAGLARVAHLTPLGVHAPDRPDGDDELLVAVAGEWFLARVRDLPDDPVAALPVVALQEHLFGPLLGIDDPRTSGRIRHLPGVPSPAAQARLAGVGETTALFVPRAVRIDEVHGVAAAGRTLPPKSTFVDPKPGPGVFLHLRGPAPDPRGRAA